MWGGATEYLTRGFEERHGTRREDANGKDKATGVFKDRQGVYVVRSPNMHLDTILT